MAIKLQQEFAEDVWRDAPVETIIAEFWKEHPDDELRKLMENWELDVHTAVLYKLVAGDIVSSRRGYRYRLTTGD